MNKLLMTLLLGIFLIGMVSATSIVVSHGADMGGEEGNDITAKRGLNITSLNNYNLTNLIKPSFTNATKCYLYDADNNLMNSSVFVGNTCTLGGNNTLLAGRQYKWLMDRDGLSYSINGSLPALPINSEGIVWNQGIFGASQNGQVFGFTNATLLIINNKLYDFNQYGYEATVYEIDSSNYSVNLSSTSNNFTSSRLIYDSTEYTGSIVNTGGLNYTITASIPALPLAGVKSFYWNVTFNDSTTAITQTKTQTISQTIFTKCNATYTTPFINFTFKDEGNQSSISSTIPSSTFTYWIGSQSVNKTLSFSNVTANPSYAFCSNINRTFSVDTLLRYSNTNYPQRIYQPGILSLTNVTTNKVLYLLESDDGLYVTFQVVNSADQPIDNVYVTANTTISGVSTQIGSGFTDAAGTITFWVNPNAEHIFTFNKTGYSLFTYTTTPSQSSYTVNLGQGTVVNQYDYSRGISYSIRPIDEPLNKSQIYQFNFTLSTSYWSIDSFGFILRNQSTTLNSTSSTSDTGGTVIAFIDTQNNSVIYMDYFYVVNGTYNNFTRSWIVYDFSGRDFSLAHFFDDFKAYVGTDDGIFGLKSDSLSLNMIIFVFILLVTGLISYKFSFNSPAPVLGILWALVAFFDVALGLIWNPPLATDAGISNFPTIFIGLITIAFVIKEVSQ